eukprot:scaffold136552_cov112-Phaeocystis_antarctica.AAC.1
MAPAKPPRMICTTTKVPMVALAPMPASVVLFKGGACGATGGNGVRLGGGDGSGGGGDFGGYGGGSGGCAGGATGGESKRRTSVTSTSEEVQTVTGTSACSAATAMRSAGSISVGSTWIVVLPMETVTKRAVALRHAEALEMLEALEALEALKPAA